VAPPCPSCTESVLRRRPAARQRRRHSPVASRDRFVSWNGTAPLDASSGSQARHRLSRAGNRRINRVLHIMAVVQRRNQAKGPACYGARRDGGMPSMMAMRALRRRLSNVVFSRMLADR
jgi:transposase